MKTLYPIFLFAICFISANTSSAQGNFYVISNSVATTSPNNCSSTTVDVTTYLGCINFVNNGSTFSISNDTINISVNYAGSFICQGVITQPVFNVNLDTLAAGNYTIASTAFLDLTPINTVYTPLSVASCCSPTTDLEAIFSISDSIFCEGERIQLTNRSVNALTFNWYVNNVLTTTMTQPFLDSLPAGSYSVRLEADSASCTDDTTISFLVSPKPTVSLGLDTTICQGSSLTLFASGSNSNGVSYLWSDSTTADSLLVTQAGTYTALVTDSFGCSSIDTIVVSVSVCTGILDKKSKTSLIHAFPNPMSNGQNLWLTTDNESETAYFYDIINTLGKKVKSGNITLSKNPTSLDTKSLKQGIFFVQIRNENRVISTTKIVIK